MLWECVSTCYFCIFMWAIYLLFSNIYSLEFLSFWHKFRLNPPFWYYRLDVSLHKVFFYIASWIFRLFPLGSFSYPYREENVVVCFSCWLKTENVSIMMIEARHFYCVSALNIWKQIHGELALCCKKEVCNHGDIFSELGIPNHT